MTGAPGPVIAGMTRKKERNRAKPEGLDEDAKGSSRAWLQEMFYHDRAGFSNPGSLDGDAAITASFLPFPDEPEGFGRSV